MQEKAKYICGCGKSYSSYPAFSTHKKLKHANHEIEGTNLPKLYAPKRGRPSFSLPPRDKKQKQSFYTSLTGIQIGILSLSQKHKDILSELDHQQADINFQQKYQNDQRIITTRTGLKLNESIKRFNEVLSYHINAQLSLRLTEYLLLLNSYLQNNISPDQPIQFQWQSQQKIKNIRRRIDSSLFNSFLTKKKNQQKIKWLSKDTVKVEFYYQITVLLAEYLFKTGIVSNKLILKDK